MTMCGAALFAQDRLFSIGSGAAVALNYQILKFKNTDMQASYGFHVGPVIFVDARYVELNTCFFYGNVSSDYGPENGDNTLDVILNLNIKYPFLITERFDVFPFLGVDYRINVLNGEKDGTASRDKADYFNAPSLILGVGTDFHITERIYLRGEIGGGIIFNTKNEDDIKDTIAFNFKSKEPIKFAVGFKL